MNTPSKITGPAALSVLDRPPLPGLAGRGAALRGGEGLPLLQPSPHREPQHQSHPTPPSPSSILDPLSDLLRFSAEMRALHALTKLLSSPDTTQQYRAAIAILRVTSPATARGPRTPARRRRGIAFPSAQCPMPSALLLPSPVPLRADNLSFSYTPRKPILRDISASFEPGSVTALLGPNGAGKTTLLRLLLALRTPSAGRITLDDRDLADIPLAERASRLAYIPQSASVAFPFSVRQVVRTGLFAAASTSTTHGRAVDEALRRLDLADLADEPFGTLSAGQQQRVSVARALAQLSRTDTGGAGVSPASDRPPLPVSSGTGRGGRVLEAGEGLPLLRSPSQDQSPNATQATPSSSALVSPLATRHSPFASSSRFLLADEPISAMDPRHALQTLSLFRELARSGLTVILVLHDLPTALNHADHALLLGSDGSVAAAGPVHDTLTPLNLERVFSVPFERVRSDSGLTAALLPVDPSTLERTPARARSEQP